VADIHLEKTIAADPRTIYHALTAEEGLASFWTDQVQAEPRQGSIASFSFGPKGAWERFEMQIERLDPEQLVHWRCVGAKDDEWHGTQIRWELEPRADVQGTRLRFHHLEWPSADGALPRCAFDWGSSAPPRSC
jgi:uncharacterized protein YndB with AHSA1/START domain